MEYRLHDGTRVDCLTESYAIEFDFSNKWAEAIGQSLYYAVETKRLPGIVLILEKQSDERHLKRLMKTAAPYGIRVWTISNFPTKTKEVQQ
ncbi:hypothetical protein [uncultured Desulfuromonas sp.]|uniref:hypothetical protein n=1 Tax=uncultured Desulfuromonas sp. TaxID=181013 RepID=UPI002AAAC00F|nr:hypothetical protein [uncultured Desulfuromonas sp.]